MSRNNSYIECYPTAAGAEKSPYYSLTVNGQEIFVEKASKFDIPVHYAHFSLSGDADLEVRVSRDIHTYCISPKSKKIKSSADKRVISFYISEPGYFVLKVNALEYLFILIDPMESNRPILVSPGVKSILDYGVDNTGKTVETEKIQEAINQVSNSCELDTLYFPAGIYLTGNLEMKSDVTLYLAGGALVQGSDNPEDYPDISRMHFPGQTGFNYSQICFNGVKNAAIKGRGGIDGNGKTIKYQGIEGNLLKIFNSTEVEIEGVYLRNSSGWNTHISNSSDITLRNIKVINNVPYLNWSNTDGINPDCSSNVSIDNAFMYCGDDCFAVKGNGKPELFDKNTQGITVRNAVCISSCAALKIGTETTSSSIKDIKFINIDIIYARRAMVVDCFDNVAVENVIFENIRVEELNKGPGIHKPKLIEVQIPAQTWRPCAGECHIKNIRFKNIHSDVMHPSYIYGKAEDYRVENIAFDDFHIEDKPIMSTSEGSIKTNEFAINITFSSLHK